MVPSELPLSSVSRRTFFSIGGVGLAALLAPVAAAGPATAASPSPDAVPADFPQPASGGIPPGPSTYGWIAQDLLAFDPATDPWSRHLRCLVPRARRIAPFAPTQAHPDLDPAVRLSTLTIDDAGSIYEGRNQPIGLEPQVYTQRFWPYIDVWGTWHGQVLKTVSDEVLRTPGSPLRKYGVIDLPNPGWVEAAHKNGAKAIGGWFWPRDTMAFDEFLVQRADGSFPVGDKIVEIKRYFGFDGLFINQEATISAEQVRKLAALFAYIKTIDDDFYLQYYDAVLPASGTLDYQNELNSRNAPWLGTPDRPLVDSIFINYDWPTVDPGLVHSAAVAGAAGFDPRVVVFAGVEHQQGGFNPMECFGDVAAPGKPGPVSCALFVDTQFWLNASWDGITSTVDGRATYRDLEQRFWSGPTGNPTASGRQIPRTPPYRRDVLNYKKFDGIAHSVVEKSPYAQFPIATTFTVGVGSKFWLGGQLVRDRGWDNMGCADRSLTWQYWTEGTLAVVLDETDAYEGGHSLRLSGDGVLHLFKTDIRPDRATTVQVEVKGGLSSLELGVTTVEHPGRTSWFPLRGSAAPGAWSTVRGEIHRLTDRIARISLRSSGSGSVGRIALIPAGSQAPGPVSGFAVADAGAAATAGHRHLTFEWQLREGAAAYDVLQTSGARQTWLGRVHRDVFFAESVDLSDGTDFAVVPISGAGLRGRPSAATLG